MKVNKSFLIISIATAVLLLGISAFLAMTISLPVGILCGGATFVLLGVLMLIYNRRQ